MYLDVVRDKETHVLDVVGDKVTHVSCVVSRCLCAVFLTRPAGSSASCTLHSMCSHCSAAVIL